MAYSNGGKQGELNKEAIHKGVCKGVLVKLAMEGGVGPVASAFVNAKHRASWGKTLAEPKE